MGSFTGTSTAAPQTIVDDGPDAGSFTVREADATKVRNVVLTIVEGDIVLTFDPVTDAVSYALFGAYTSDVATDDYDFTFPITSGENIGAQALEVWFIIVAVFADASYGTPSDVGYDPGV
jgi:hypothetical protein